MKKADNPVVFITGNNNKVSFGGNSSLPRTIVILAIAVVVLAISLCCPEMLADFVRWIVSIAINS